MEATLWRSPGEPSQAPPPQPVREEGRRGAPTGRRAEPRLWPVVPRGLAAPPPAPPGALATVWVGGHPQKARDAWELDTGGIRGPARRHGCPRTLSPSASVRTLLPPLRARRCRTPLRNQVPPPTPTVWLSRQSRVNARFLSQFHNSFHYPPILGYLRCFQFIILPFLFVLFSCYGHKIHTKSS